MILSYFLSSKPIIMKGLLDRQHSLNDKKILAKSWIRSFGGILILFTISKVCKIKKASQTIKMLNTTTVNIEKVSSVSTFEIGNDSQQRKKN